MNQKYPVDHQANPNIHAKTSEDTELGFPDQQSELQAQTHPGASEMPDPALDKVVSRRAMLGGLLAGAAVVAFGARAPRAEAAPAVSGTTSAPNQPAATVPNKAPAGPTTSPNDPLLEDELKRSQIRLNNTTADNLDSPSTLDTVGKVAAVTATAVGVPGALIGAGVATNSYIQTKHERIQVDRQAALAHRREVSLGERNAYTAVLERLKEVAMMPVETEAQRAVKIEARDITLSQLSPFAEKPEFQAEIFTLTGNMLRKRSTELEDLFPQNLEGVSDDEQTAAMKEFYRKINQRLVGDKEIFEMFVKTLPRMREDTDKFVDGLIDKARGLCLDYFRNVRKCDLSGLDMSGASFKGVAFKGVNFKRTKLRMSHLEGTTFTDCNIQGVNFDEVTTGDFRDATRENGSQLKESQVPGLA